MVDEIRCDKCGEFVGTNHAHDRYMWCANCNNRIEISPVVSMLPSPKLPTDKIRPGKVEIHEDVPGQPVLSHAMPWVLSLFFHVGMGVIMLFFTLLWHNGESVRTVEAATTRLDANPPLKLKFGIDLPKHKDKIRKDSNAKPPGPIAKPKLGGQDKPDGKTDHDIGLSNPNINGPKSDGIGGLLGVPGGVGEGPDFARADNVVYVIDRSGSMVDTFDVLRHELRTSIASLYAEQHFHVIMFTDGKPLENIAGRLLPATDDSKLRVGPWLEKVRPSGQTNPAQSLERAFEVLEDAKGTKLIFFLTDGVFEDNKAVLTLLTHLNADKSVHINTFLYGGRPDGLAEEVMKQIASEHGGSYNYVNPSD